MVLLVQRMIDLHRRLQTANTEHERGVLERQIAATDEEVDSLVYESYELTEEGIAIIDHRSRHSRESGNPGHRDEALSSVSGFPLSRE
jgi:hypothetical protein